MVQVDREVLLVYDGACPMCTAFSKVIRLRKALGELQLINAREQHPIIKEITNKKLDLDEGIILKYNNNFYHGVDAINLLALLSTEDDWFNRVNAIIFRSKSLSKLLYPLLRSIRNLLLLYKGKHKINNLEK